MLKIINFILLTLILYSTSVNSMYKRESTKRKQGAYNVSTGSISSRSSITSDSLYRPSLFFNNSIFSGNQNKDGSNGDKSKLCGSGEYHYNLIPDDTKDIDVIILLVDGLVAFLFSADTSFDEAYNEFIERLYLIVLFINDSVSAKYDGKIMIHICNRFTHTFQLTLYSPRDLLSKDLNMQQKQKIISALPKNLNRGTECYEDMEYLRIFLQKMIVDFIWVGDFDSETGGSLGIDTEKVVENAKTSKIKSIENLKSDVVSNRYFLNKNIRLVQLGSLRKDSKKYKKNFIASNIVHKVYLDNTEKNNTDYLIELFRKTINKRSIEQTPHSAVLPSSATDIIDIIATAFDLQKIILLLKKTQSNDIYKYLIALDSQTNEQINKLINKTQNSDNTVVFLQLKIKDALKTIILEQIKLGVSRQVLADTIINIIGEESNEMIWKLKKFVDEKTIQQQSDTLSLKSSSSKYSISNKSEDDLVLFESFELINSISNFLYSVSCSRVSNDRLLFFLDLIDKSNLYELADKEYIKYEKFDKEQTILQDKKELLIKILLNGESKNIHDKAQILFDTLSVNEKINIDNYFKDICEGAPN